MRGYEGGAGLHDPWVDVLVAHMTTSWFETAHLPNADVFARPGSRLTASTAVTISNSFGSRWAYLRTLGNVLRSATRAIALDTHTVPPDRSALGGARACQNFIDQAAHRVIDADEPLELA